MADAPYLKSIPGDVKEVKENVAKFGSKMTELESQLTSLQANVGQIKTEVQKNSKVGQKFHIRLQTSQCGIISCLKEHVMALIILCNYLLFLAKQTFRVWNFNKLFEIDADIVDVYEKS